MNKEELKNLLNEVANGNVSPDEAASRIRLTTYEDMGFAKIDTARGCPDGEGISRDKNLASHQ